MLHSVRAQQLGWKFCLYGLVALVCVIAVFPFYNAVLTSFRTGQDLFLTSYLPTTFYWHNYVYALATAGISFAGRRAILLTILCVSMFPQVAVLSGMFELVRFLGLYDSRGALILSYTTFSLPFTIWVLTTFMRTIPLELEEAAIVDGASTPTIITHVFLPIMGPSLVTTGMLAFIGAWNEFMFAMTFVLSSGKRTVPVGIAYLQGASQFELPWGSIMAASVVATLPIVIMVLIFQKRIVSGLTQGAVKG